MSGPLDCPGGAVEKRADTQAWSFRQTKAFRGRGRLRDHPAPGLGDGGLWETKAGRPRAQESGGKGPAGPAAWLRPTRPSTFARHPRTPRLRPDRYTLARAAGSPDLDSGFESDHVDRPADLGV